MSDHEEWVLFVIGSLTRPNVQLYVKAYDPDADGGHGRIEFTADPRHAKKYVSFFFAMEDWKRVSTTNPVRMDGKPNRPLSAYTVQPMRLSEAPAVTT